MSLPRWIGTALCCSMPTCAIVSKNGVLLVASFPRSIVLLNDCTRSITRGFRLLDDEGQYYFGQFRRLARRILHGVDVDQTYRPTEQEMDAELDWESAFDFCVSQEV